MDHYLSAHPDIFVAQKEMHRFGSDLHFGPQFYRRDQNAYLAEFSAWNGQACAGESSVWYLFSHQAADEIKAFNPDARIIIMLREPSAMLYSLYHQFRCDGNEHLPTFEEALAAEDDRRAGHRIARQAYFQQGLVYRATACYTRQVERYFNTFGRERVHVILYDDFAANPVETYRRTLDFLGAGPGHEAIEFGVVNGSKSVRSRALRAVLNDPLVRGAAITLRSRMPSPVFNALQKIDSWLGNFNARPDKHPPLAQELQRSIRCEFAPEVRRLGALLGRDLAHWSEPKPDNH